MDTIFQPQDDYVYSLQCKETTNGFKAGFVDWDNTNYCLVIATERLPNGHYFDGITLNNAQITITASNDSTDSTYLYPTGNASDGKNDVSPLIMFCQDCFWRCTIEDGAEFIANDEAFHSEITNDVYDEDILRKRTQLKPIKR